MYENIVLFCVMFSKMSFEMETCFSAKNVNYTRSKNSLATKGFGNKLYLDK